MKTPVFTGSCTALATPFTYSGEVDFAALGNMLELQARGGTSAIVPCGTTGENATLSDEEQRAVIKFCVENSQGMKVMPGIGGNNTSKALMHARDAEALGADAVLMVTPYYNKSSQNGLAEHFIHVADRVGVPLILYNVPSRTGIGITAETYARLAEHPNICGTKEASGDFTLISATMSLCGDELNVWSGNDDNTVAMMAMGAKGVISVASNLVPERIAELCELCGSGEYAKAARLHTELTPLFRALFAEVNPMPLKAAMGMAGLCSEEVRLPLCGVSAKTRALLAEAMGELGIL